LPHAYADIQSLHCARTCPSLTLAHPAAGTTDITASLVEEVAPLQVKEVAPASSEPHGGAHVDQAFLTFAAELFGSHWRHFDFRVRLALLDSFAAVRGRIDAAPTASSPAATAAARASSSLVDSCVFISVLEPLAAMDDAGVPAKDEMTRLVDAYNAARGLRGDDALVFVCAGVRRLRLPHSVARSFFDAPVAAIVAHMRARLAELPAAASAGRPACDVLVLTGAFAKAPVLQAVSVARGTLTAIVRLLPLYARLRFAAMSCPQAVATMVASLPAPQPRIFAPSDPGRGGTRGAILFALQPKAISQRYVGCRACVGGAAADASPSLFVHARPCRSIMRYTYAYLGAEAYDPAVHEAQHIFVVGDRVRASPHVFSVHVVASLSRYERHIARASSCLLSRSVCATCCTRWCRRVSR